MFGPTTTSTLSVVCWIAAVSWVGDLRAQVPYDRAIEEIELAPESGGMAVRFLYSLQINDASEDRLNLNADILVYVNGEVKEVISTSAVKGGAITCAVTCAGKCPSIFGDGVCTGCGCRYSDWFTTAHGSQEGDVVQIEIVPARRGAPELDTSNDAMRFVVETEKPKFDRKILEVEAVSDGEQTTVRFLYGLEVFDQTPGELVMNADVEVVVGGVVVDVVPANARKNGAIYCAVTCAGECPSIFGDGVCGGCSCNYSNWLTSAFGGGEDGETVELRIVAARGGAPEANTTNDALRATIELEKPRFDRRLEEVDVQRDGERTVVRFRYGLEVFDDSPGELVMNADVEVMVNGVMLDIVPADASKNSAITCAVTCAGECPSIFGDGVCTGCSCRYSNWLTSAFGGGEDGDMVELRIVAARGGAREFETGNDTLVARIPPRDTTPRFVRGDCNGDGEVVGQVSDVIFQLNWLFGGGPDPACLEACDANGDGKVIGQVSDVIFQLNWLFQGGPSPQAPFPECEPASGTLSCLASTAGCS